MKSRAHVRIRGQVQGVMFRSFVRNQATLSRLTGWVKNNDDGSVDAVFEGEKEDVEKVVNLCHKGPHAAVVEDVDVEWEEYKGEFDSFEIRHKSGIEL